jgi:hypothetical protein
VTKTKFTALVWAFFGSAAILAALGSIIPPFADPSPHHWKEFKDAILLIVATNGLLVIIGLASIAHARRLWKKKPD